MSQARATSAGVKRAQYKYRGPETWALVRQAYLGGETAGSVAKRFDVGVDALRRRATNEGWTRKEHAAAVDPAAALHPNARRPEEAHPPRPAGGRVPARAPAAYDVADTTPAELLRRALRQASDALAEGRTADARTLAQMAESLSRTAAREPKTPLETILRALTDLAFRTELFRVDPDADDDPDLPVKREYWRWSAARQAAATARPRGASVDL